MARKISIRRPPRDIYYAKYYGKGGGGQLEKKKLGVREKNEKGGNVLKVARTSVIGSKSPEKKRIRIRELPYVREVNIYNNKTSQTSFLNHLPLIILYSDMRVSVIIE